MEKISCRAYLFICPRRTKPEASFYSAAYSKFVKGDDVKSRQILGAMHQLAPYGSTEWIYGKRVLQ